MEISKYSNRPTAYSCNLFHCETCIGHQIRIGAPKTVDCYTNRDMMIFDKNNAWDMWCDSEVFYLHFDDFHARSYSSLCDQSRVRKSYRKTGTANRNGVKYLHSGQRSGRSQHIQEIVKVKLNRLNLSELWMFFTLGRTTEFWWKYICFSRWNLLSSWCDVSLHW